jgi:selenium-binding protein 1
MAGGKYLYVWLGDDKRVAADRIAVVDFDPASPHYGSILSTVELPGPGSADNEPHHCMISADKKVLGCGGLLSVLRDQNSLFFFSLADPAHPTFISSTRAAESAVTDDFRPMPGGGYLVTNMGSATGGSPGRVIEVDSQHHVTHEWPDQPPTDGFNPHGITLRPDLNLMLTSDFIDPASTLNTTPGPVQFRGSIRVWDLAARTITKTIRIAGAPGTMDVKGIPHDPRGCAYTAGLLNGKLYLVDPIAGTARTVYDLNSIAPGAAPQVMVLSTDGKRLFVPMESKKGGEVAMFDVSQPDRPRLLASVELGAGSGPHDSMLTMDGRLVISDYFLDEDGFGKVHEDGDRRVRVYDVAGTGLRADARFNLDFHHAIPGLDLRPHGMDAL